MSKINKILVAAVVVLLLILAGFVIWGQFMANPNYYAVYLRTGDLYFGRLVRFPYFGLRQVYMLQVNTQNQQTPVSIQRFANIFWGPEDFLKINRDQVVWVTKLNPDGQLAQLIKTNPTLMPLPSSNNQGSNSNVSAPPNSQLPNAPGAVNPSSGR